MTMNTMTANVENWQYKTKAEVEALDDKTLFELQKELSEAFKQFNIHRVPATAEMAWLLMVIPWERVRLLKLDYE